MRSTASSPPAIVKADLPSQKRSSATALSARRTRSSLESAKTMGLLCRECAQMGVRINASMSGVRIEPPAESE